jgi:hypothetical protein
MTQPHPITMAELHEQLCPTPELKEASRLYSLEMQKKFPCVGTRCLCQAK